MDPNSWCYTDSAVESPTVKEALWGGSGSPGGIFLERKCIGRMSWHPAHGRHVRVSTLVLVVFLVLAGGCATMPDPGDPEAVAEFNKVNDPAEPANRAIFELNRSLDTAFLKPVATFYRDVIP